MATANALKNWNRTQQQKRVCDVQETSDESILEVLFDYLFRMLLVASANNEFSKE